MTQADKAYEWLAERGGDGIFQRNQVLLARGELAPFMRSTWTKLVKAGRAEIYLKKRIRLVKCQPQP